MAKKLDNEDLKNVSGGACAMKGTCHECGQQGRSFWKARFTEPSVGHSEWVAVCPDCAKKLKKDFRYNCWEKLPWNCWEVPH